MKRRRETEKKKKKKKRSPPNREEKRIYFQGLGWAKGPKRRCFGSGFRFPRLNQQVPVKHYFLCDNIYIFFSIIIFLFFF